jgi:hypothetical protein
MRIKLMIDSSNRERLRRLAVGMSEIFNREVEMLAIPRVGDCVFLSIDEGGPLMVKSVTWTPFEQGIDAVVILET